MLKMDNVIISCMETLNKTDESYEDTVGDVDGSVWNLLTDKQKKAFKRLTEKSKENLNYIG